MSATERLANRGAGSPPPGADRQLCALAHRRQHAVLVRCRTAQRQRVLDMGKVGQALTVDQGYEAAKLCGLNLIANMKSALGSIDRVDTVLKVFGMVNAAPNFIEHPKVINGCTDCRRCVRRCVRRQRAAARSAVGMGSRPGEYFSRNQKDRAGEITRSVNRILTLRR